MDAFADTLLTPKAVWGEDPVFQAILKFVMHEHSESGRPSSAVYKKAMEMARDEEFVEMVRDANGYERPWYSKFDADEDTYAPLYALCGECAAQFGLIDNCRDEPDWCEDCDDRWKVRSALLRQERKDWARIREQEMAEAKKTHKCFPLDGALLELPREVMQGLYANSFLAGCKFCTDRVLWADPLVNADYAFYSNYDWE